MHPHHLQQCKNIAEKLYKSRAAIPFRQPVDPIELGIPDYFEVIQNPIDLGTIKTKLAQQEYQTLEQFVADVRLVWSNCLTYNRPGSPICKVAQNLSQMFEDLLQGFDHSEPDTLVPIPLEDEEEGENFEGDEESEEEEEEEEEYGNKQTLSEFERIRLQNIEKNKEMMKSLGLDTSSLNMFKPKVVPVLPLKRKLNFKPTIQAPTRSSKRKKGFHSSPLFTAVRDKNMEEIIQILSTTEGASQVNEKNGMNEETPLHLAVTIGDVDITKTLLAQDNIDVDAQDIRGWTPFAIAKTNGFQQIADLLKEAGASPAESLTVFKKTQKKTARAKMGSDFSAPQAPTDQNRCTCCHTCRTSLTLYPREYKACSCCPYIYCKNCFESKPFLKMSWEQVQKVQNFVCEVCLGRCVCSRCCTRGPPRWFGHQNEKFRDPATVEVEINNYQEKAKEALQERMQSVASPPKEKPASPSVQYQQKCSCCHICRKSITSSGTLHKSCSTCSYIICKPCFGKRISETWEEAEQTPKWSCTVCHGICECSRCKKRGHPHWYGQLKKQIKPEDTNTLPVIDHTSIIETAAECLPLLEPKMEIGTDIMNMLNFEEDSESPDDTPSSVSSGGFEQSCIPSLFDESVPSHLFIQPAEFKEMDVF